MRIMITKDVKLLFEAVMPILAHSPAMLIDKGFKDSGLSALELRRSDRYYKEDELFPEDLMRNFCRLILHTKKLVQRISYTNRIESELMNGSQFTIIIEGPPIRHGEDLKDTVKNPRSKKLFRLMQMNIRYVSEVDRDHIGRLIQNNLINPYFKLAKDIQPLLSDSLKIANTRFMDTESIKRENAELTKKINLMASYYQEQDFKRSRNGFESKPRVRATSIKAFMRGLFLKYEALSIVRFDLLYVAPRLGEQSKGHNSDPGIGEIVSQYLPEIRKFISLIKNRESSELDSIASSLVSYMVVADYNKYKGMHFHVMLFSSSPMSMSQKDRIVDTIDNVWRNLTKNNLGFAYPCNQPSGSYRFSSIGTLNKNDWFKDADLQRAIYYFTRPSHFLKLDTSEHLFFKGQVVKSK